MKSTKEAHLRQIHQMMLWWPWNAWMGIDCNANSFSQALSKISISLADSNSFTIGRWMTNLVETNFAERNFQWNPSFAPFESYSSILSSSLRTSQTRSICNLQCKKRVAVYTVRIHDRVVHLASWQAPIDLDTLRAPPHAATVEHAILQPTVVGLAVVERVIVGLAVVERVIVGLAVADLAVSVVELPVPEYTVAELPAEPSVLDCAVWSARFTHFHRFRYT